MIMYIDFYEKDDWDVASLECKKEQDQGNITFNQPYLQKQNSHKTSFCYNHIR